jgi:class 3 adenylate cyclase
VAVEISPPSGTVTFVFTDVEGSSALWAEDAGAMSASLRLHDEIVWSVVDAHGGYVFTTAGDSFSLAFDRASAVAARRCDLALSASAHTSGRGLFKDLLQLRQPRFPHLATLAGDDRR